MTHPLLDTYLGLVLKRAERLAEEAKVWAPLGLQQELWALLSDVRCVRVYMDKLLTPLEDTARSGPQTGG